MTAPYIAKLAMVAFLDPKALDLEVVQASCQWTQELKMEMKQRKNFSLRFKTFFQKCKCYTEVELDIILS